MPIYERPSPKADAARIGRATPLRDGDACPDGPSLGSQSLAGLRDPAVQAMFQVLIDVTMPLCSGVHASTDAWMRSASKTVLDAYGSLTRNRSGPVGAWVALMGVVPGEGSGASARFGGGRGMPRAVTGVATSGYQGYSQEQVEDIAAGAATDAETWQAWVGASSRGLVDADRGLLITEPSSTDERVRVTTPLGRFVRGIQPLLRSDASRVLVWQVDGRAGVWLPSAADVAAGELMGMALAKGFDLGVIVPERRRADLKAKLSPSQAPILPLLAQGLNQRQIGERIGRSLHTVHDHVKGIYAALGIKSRYELYVLWNGGDVSQAAGMED